MLQLSDSIDYFRILLSDFELAVLYHSDKVNNSSKNGFLNQRLLEAVGVLYSLQICSLKRPTLTRIMFDFTSTSFL